MDYGQVAGLTAELKAQMRLIDRVYQRLNDRAASGLETPAQLESVAYQIHNLYCAVEDLLKLVANAFENQLGASSAWHRMLLLRLSQPVEGIRPAFLSEEAFDCLNRLRGFRHFIRHGYGAEIELTQLQTNLAAAIDSRQLISQDLHRFLGEIGDRDEA